ncbi:MAG: glycoside hydrolase family 9 protein [Haliscomenobacter sp.]|nr:glycoside hydrolase family 9 protein [Haliscomenobacter sp.]
MKYSSFFFFLCFLQNMNAQSTWIRINQLGYLPDDTKVAVLVSKETPQVSSFELCEANTHKVVFTSRNIQTFGPYAAFRSGCRLNFSRFNLQGRFYVRAAGVRSPNFRIASDVYAGTADFILRYMRQQRSGYNPYLKDSCHTQDGYIVYHPDPVKNGTHLDVSGGWHDASDYLQYVATSANATFQMLFAYQQNPGSFGDGHDASGNPIPNGIPDVLDEAKWGLDWLLKMNPAKEEMYNQLADDRDHLKMRLPTLDSVVYDAKHGYSRPVYFVTGKPQGLLRYQNRSKGVASTAGKYASAFALGSRILAPFYPEYAQKLLPKAWDAYEFGRKYPGVCQTAPCRAPYFYEEDNDVDDMELAAAQLFQIAPQRSELLQQASAYGQAEPTTPWMGADTARHYQWYPFVNLGHYLLAQQGGTTGTQFQQYLKAGIEKVKIRGQNNPFLNGVPFIWCSNNLTVGILTQLHLYHQLSKDDQYQELEAALRDWLFGCNPWGTSMIYGLPADGDTPADPHSAFTNLYNYPIDGGLVDGPIYGSIFGRLIGITMHEADEYAEFQSKLVVYHDDYGDYSSNEPTMDGTASLSYILSAYEKAGKTAASTAQHDVFGSIQRLDPSQPVVYLSFTGHEYGEGTAFILRSLKKAGVKASFFLTGDFLRNPAFKKSIKKMVKEGHYLGPHSDKHLLYCDWGKRDSLLLTRAQFTQDLQANLRALQGFQVKTPLPYFMPPYEWYNEQIVDWSTEQGLQVINFTPLTGTNADYTTPTMANYRSSETLYQGLLDFEKNDPQKLNGAVVLIHLGTDPARKDKLYARLPDLIRDLREKGYRFAGEDGLVTLHIILSIIHPFK